MKAELAYCDTQGGDLPLLIGYNGKTQELLFATVYDTGAKAIGGDLCSWYGSGGWRS